METIPEPLRDRMEIIDISGYVAEEKLKIAQQYLLPQVSELTGLKLDDGIIIQEEALNKLIKSYCRESGVRNLRKHIEKIFRKAAFINVSEGQSGISVNEDNLTDYVGKPVVTHRMLEICRMLAQVFLHPAVWRRRQEIQIFIFLLEITE